MYLQALAQEAIVPLTRFSHLKNSSIPQKMLVRGYHVGEKEPIFLFILHLLMCIFLRILTFFLAELSYLFFLDQPFWNKVHCILFHVIVRLTAMEKLVLRCRQPVYNGQINLFSANCAFHSSPGISDSSTISLFVPQTEGGWVNQCVLPALEGHSHACFQLLLRIAFFFLNLFISFELLL